jgi:Predicted membrane protein
MDMGFIAWIVVGLIAGWLAGQVMKGGGYGVLVDIILGILGGILGGWFSGAWESGPPAECWALSLSHLLARSFWSPLAVP